VNWLGPCCQQLAEHVLQNAAIGVILGFLWRIDAHHRLDLRGFAVFRRFHLDLPAR